MIDEWEKRMIDEWEKRVIGEWEKRVIDEWEKRKPLQTMIDEWEKRKPLQTIQLNEVIATKPLESDVAFFFNSFLFVSYENSILLVSF